MTLGPLRRGFQRFFLFPGGTTSLSFSLESADFEDVIYPWTDTLQPANFVEVPGLSAPPGHAICGFSVGRPGLALCEAPQRNGSYAPKQTLWAVHIGFDLLTLKWVGALVRIGAYLHVYACVSGAPACACTFAYAHARCKEGGAGAWWMTMRAGT